MNIMIKTIKEVHKEDICFFKSGGFYHCYGRDAYILSYLLNYKILGDMADGVECGFPVNALSKVEAQIEKRRINFLVIDNRNNFMVDEVSNNGNLNKYNEFYEKARNYINYKRRINEINSFLIQNIEKKDFRKVLGKLEKIVDEEREVFSN